MINRSFGIVSRWPLVLVMGAALAGCFEDKSDGAGGAVVSSATGGGSSLVATSPPATITTTTNRAPEISGIPAATAKVGVVYSFTPVASDEDDDFLEFEITNKPAWAQFSAETGVLTGTPAPAHVGISEDITITVTDGAEQRAIGPFRITVASTTTSNPANTAPTISGTPLDVADAGIEYNFAPTALDADGNTLTFSISNRPSWMTFSTTTGQLKGTPSTSNVGDYSNILISVNDGQETTLLSTFSIKVRGPANHPPSISGTATASIQASQLYSFQPLASDPDGDKLSFSISNLPAWAAFTSSTGKLSGTPTSANVGTYSNIVIRVSDGRAKTSLPAFSITVTAAPTQPTTTQPNRAPTISGSAPTTATVGTAYSFQPTASDPDGNALAWTIENRPSWLTFNTATGRLSGTPTTTSVVSSIIVRVSDGTLSASLPAFSITTNAAPVVSPPPPSTGNATLSWQAPSENTDGSALTNLAGYRILYGKSQTAMDQSVTISNPGTTTYVVEGLAPATWYFSVKAYSTAGIESANSSVASKTIQ